MWYDTRVGAEIEPLSIWYTLPSFRSFKPTTFIQLWSLTQFHIGTDNWQSIPEISWKWRHKLWKYFLTKDKIHSWLCANFSKAYCWPWIVRDKTPLSFHLENVLWRVQSLKFKTSCNGPSILLLYKMSSLFKFIFIILPSSSYYSSYMRNGNKLSTYTRFMLSCSRNLLP